MAPLFSAQAVDAGKMNRDQQMSMTEPIESSSSSQVRRVLVDAQRDLDNADLLFGFIANPIREHILKPVLSVATDVVPAVAGVVPFGDEVAAFSLSIPFNTLRFGYSILHLNGDNKLTTILQDAEREFRDLTDVRKWEQDLDPMEKQDIIGWRGYLIATTVELLSDPVARLSEWKHAADSLSAFLEETGLAEEYRVAKKSPRFDNNLRIIGNIQQVYSSSIARREMTCLEIESGTFQTSLKEVAKLMRYSTAAFGKDTMEAQEVYSGKDVSLFDSNALPFDSIGQLNKDALQLGSEALKQKVCDHVGIPKEYIRYFLLGYGGNMKLLRHFIAVDHDLEAVVLVIRGTQSNSGWNIDAQGMAMPFCNGVAHAGIGTMAHAVMANSKGEILKALAEFPDYRLIITGHSLGSGMACLVNILCHVDNDIGKYNIECHAFGGPPVYLQGNAHPYVDEAIKNSVVYVHREDSVPHISMYNCRRLLRQLAAVDEVTEKMSTVDQDLIGAGRKMPTAELVEAVRTGDANLPGVPGAPRLILPASRIVWFQKDEAPETGTKYNMMVCDPKKFAALGFLVSQDMFSDHPPPVYETCLNEIETLGWDVLDGN